MRLFLPRSSICYHLLPSATIWPPTPLRRDRSNSPIFGEPKRISLRTSSAFRLTVVGRHVREVANSCGKSLSRDDEHRWVDSPNRGAATPIRTPTPTFSGDAFPGCFGLTDGGSPSRCRAYFVAAFLTTAFFATDLESVRGSTYHHRIAKLLEHRTTSVNVRYRAHQH